MRIRSSVLVVAALLAAFILTTQSSAQADTFGSASNAFTIDFVHIANAGNAADATGYGAVPYDYRIGVYEVSHDVITRATLSGLANVTAGIWAGSQPAGMNWYEAAAFVNWLNTSSGYQAAYNLTFSGSWSMTPWSSADAWQVGGENLFRHKDAFYFLPSENEWYKAAYHKNDGVTANYWDYPTGSDTAPAAVASGTSANTAVFNNATNAPAPVNQSGGLSAYDTMGQGGNAIEWLESAFDGTNNAGDARRVVRGGFYETGEFFLSSSYRGANNPAALGGSVGFRVASVPEPSTYALLLMTGAGALWWARRRR